MNNADYWARRFKIMEDALKDQSYEYVLNLEKQFDAAIREIDTQMRAWYQRFAVNNNITLAEAQKMLTTGELKEFLWTVQEYIEKGREMSLSGAWIKELENASARVHISRLDALKFQLRQQAEALAQARVKATTDASRLAYTQSYYHTAFEVQRGLGVGWTMQALNEDAIKKVLSRPWTPDNQTFTARCWTDKKKLVETVNQEITQMMARGAAPDKAIEAIAKRFNTSKTNAGRVVMTESAYFSSAAQKDCFNELDVELYKVIGTLDIHTCDICGDFDGRIYKMSEYVVGSTAPPFHPWCRCCTAPYFADMEGIGERYARDAETGERYKLPKDTTYKQWKQMQDTAHGSGFVDKQRKMVYNKSADMAQFDAYKARLGDDAPKSFADFQKLKYDNPSAYEDLCGHYRYKGRVPEATKGNYRTYKAIKATGINGSVRVPPLQPQPVHILEDKASKRDPAHIMHRMEERGLTAENMQSYVDNALFSVSQFKGTRRVFYSAEGVTVLTRTNDYEGIDWIAKTAWNRSEFDEIAENAIKEALNNAN